MKIGNHEVIHNENSTTFLPIYDLDGVCQDCVYLEKIRPLFDEKDKEIDRLNNIIKEKNKLISNIISKIEKVVIETKIYQQDRELSVEEILKELYEVKDLGSDKKCLTKKQTLKY